MSREFRWTTFGEWGGTRTSSKHPLTLGGTNLDLCQDQSAQSMIPGHEAPTTFYPVEIQLVGPHPELLSWKFLSFTPEALSFLESPGDF